MIAAAIASVLFGGSGACHVPVVRGVYNYGNYGHVAAVNYGHANYATTYHASPYYTQSVLAYRVEDSEKAALLRVVEKQTDALTGELKAERARADRNEVSQAVPPPPPEADEPPQRLPQKAAGDGKTLVTQFCGKCHGGGKSQGEFTIALPSGPAGESATQKLARKIAHNSRAISAVLENEMPPKSERQPSKEQVQAIAEFFNVSREELKAAAKGGK